MDITRVIGLVLLVVGIVMLIFGINSTNKFNEQVIDQMTGRYSDQTMLYIIGGIAALTNLANSMHYIES